MHNKLSMEPVVLFANPPNLQDLCAITVTLTPQVTHSQVASTWQPQILKCREIIFTEPDIIATPAFDMGNSFHVVLQQSLFKTGKLQNRFQKIGLESSKPCRVNPALYQSCLMYTLLAKIAPTWNKAGDWLVNGRDFLTHTGYSNAIKMTLTVNRDELFVSLLADCVKFPPLELMDLDVDDHFLRQLLLSRPDVAKDMHLFNCWCHVLPSMKRGRICSVSRNIPQEGPFRSYRDLKRHWKNTYGYRLPDTEEDILFYEISFRQNGGKLFTYPSVCLRRTQMQSIPRIDPKPILTSFIQDLHSKLPSICGHPLKFLPKVRYAIPELYESGQERNSIPPNLSNKNPVPSGVPMRNMKDLSNMYTHRPAAPLSETYQRLQEGARYSASFQQAMQPRENNSLVQSTPRTSYDTSRSGISMADLIAHHESTSDSGIDISAVDRKPQFMMHKTDAQQQNTHDLSEATDEVIPPSQNAGHRIVPMFRPKVLKRAALTREIAQPKAVPVFKPKHLEKPLTCQNKSHIPANKPRGPNKTSETFSNLPNDVSWMQRHTTVSSFTTRPIFTRNIEIPIAKYSGCHKQSTPQNSMKCFSLKQSKRTSHAVQVSPSTIIPSNATPKNNHNIELQSPSVSGSTDLAKDVAILNSNRSTSSFKRSAAEDDNDSCLKKPRAKPQIQDVDVEILARAHQLNKVNSVTLLAWLRKKNVPCKAKDKKAELITQVYHILHLQSSET